MSPQNKQSNPSLRYPVITNKRSECGNLVFAFTSFFFYTLLSFLLLFPLKEYRENVSLELKLEGNVFPLIKAK
ncbi:MAG: hypothetical protein DRI33_04655 [Caldiserica bacterium]|nr:MAG: hypothetical protein DRI33_04655 [Caldisericota bacterium]